MVRQVSCREVKAAVAGGRRLIDVRTPGEWELVHLPEAELLDEALLAAQRELPPATPLALLCHHGHRSASASGYFARLGFTDVWNVIGGIEAWAIEVDPSLPRY